MMRLIANRQGLSTDVSRDHLYTDWAAVDDYAKQIAGLAAEPASAPAAGTAGRGG